MQLGILVLATVGRPVITSLAKAPSSSEGESSSCESDAASLIQGRPSITAGSRHVRPKLQHGAPHPSLPYLASHHVVPSRISHPNLTKTQPNLTKTSQSKSHHVVHSLWSDPSVEQWTLLTFGEGLSIPWHGNVTASPEPGLHEAELFESDRWTLFCMCIVMSLALCLNCLKVENLFLITLLLLWMTSSVAMNIVNKIALKVLPLPMTLLIAQMLIAVILLLLLYGPVSLLNDIYTHADFSRRWSLLTVFFAAGLITSMLALNTGSVTFLIIMRNLMPLCSLVVERQLLPQVSTRPITLEAVVALATLASGTALYAAFDLTMSRAWNALGWVILNTLIMISYRLMERRVLLDLPRTLSFGPLILMQNVCGMLPVVLLFFTWGEHRALSEYPYLFKLDHWRDPAAALCIVFSACAGLSLGFYSTMLQKEITATTMLALQSSLKVVVITLAIFVLGEHVGSWSAVGCIISLLGGVWYGFIASRPQPPSEDQPAKY